MRQSQSSSSGTPRRPIIAQPRSAGGAPLRARRVAMVTNPISGRGRGRQARDLLLGLLERAGIDVVEVVTEGPGEGAAFVESLPQRPDAVLGVGGDGTIHELVGVLAGSGIPLAIMPLGTGNVLAKEHGIPRQIEQAFDVFLEGGVRHFDLGRANGRLFHAMVTVGIDAAVVHRLASRRHGPMPMTAYVPAALGTFFSFPLGEMEVTVDGVTLDRAVRYVAIANTRAYGGPITVAAEARSDDGELDVVALAGAIRWRLPWLFLRALGEGVSRARSAVVVRGRRITVCARRPVPVQCDGEMAGTTPIEIEVVPAALALCVPASPPPA